jgi:DNA-directed RNA polymerase specialized sigma24 family protein
VRRTVTNPEDARDLTQGFFAHLLAARSIARADPAKGRFRSFLLGAMKHFLADERDKARTRKRSGEVEIVSLDAAFAESRYGCEPSTSATPESHFDRGWALAHGCCQVFLLLFQRVEQSLILNSTFPAPQSGV